MTATRSGVLGSGESILFTFVVHLGGEGGGGGPERRESIADVAGCLVPRGTNTYGYAYHFDIMAQSEVFGDNVVVDFEEVDCPSAAASDYAQCSCAAS